MAANADERDMKEVVVDQAPSSSPIDRSSSQPPPYDNPISPVTNNNSAQHPPLPTHHSSSSFQQQQHAMGNYYEANPAVSPQSTGTAPAVGGVSPQHTNQAPHDPSSFGTPQQGFQQQQQPGIQPYQPPAAQYSQQQQQAYNQAPQQGQQQQTASNTNEKAPVMGQQGFKYVVPLQTLTSAPAPVQCPACHAVGLTHTRAETGNFTHAVAAVVCFLTCLGCIPYCIDGFKDFKHQCGNCGVTLATWHRSGRTEVHLFS